MPVWDEIKRLFRKLYIPIIAGVLVIAIVWLIETAWDLTKTLDRAIYYMLPDRIESGENLRIHHRNDATLMHKQASCPNEGGARGQVNKLIEFKRPFKEKPTVILALNRIDHVIDGWEGTVSGKNLRIAADVVEITTTGFRYNLKTWCNSSIAEARASWIAFGR